MKNNQKYDLAIYGGTFDPIHKGHIEVAKISLKYLKINKILFVPAGNPYLKSNIRKITNAQIRLEMIQLALKDENEPKFSVSDIEIKKTGPSYTLDTVIEFKKKNIKPIVVLGIDSVLSMAEWENPEALIKESKILAITRPGFNTAKFKNLKIKGIQEAVEILKVDTPNITSSDIRNRIKSDIDIKNMLSPSVEKFIRNKHVYK
jgi:nicotinate-nucleotide adenylyltransferase